MKEVILSADGEIIVYSVPDAAAEDLKKYCIEFCDKWMKTSPNAVKYKLKGGFCFNEADFIDYLNEYIFPDERSTFVKSLDWTDLGRDIPEEYQGLPYFNF